MYDVVALGELLIDFIQNGNSSNGNPVFEANPGGAPCNVLSMLTGLGYKTAFIGKVGDDYFGKMLGNTIKRIGISDKGLIYDKEVNTTLAIVHTMEDGDRDFSFYRKPGADIMLDEKDVCKELIENCRIFHFGSLATVYKGNIIKNLIMDCQSYTKYRPNETTGGIFVSWRRKEELPTGA